MSRDKIPEKKIVRSFTALPQELKMLAVLADYHGFSKSGTIRNLVKKEFWRVFPAGTDEIRPVAGAKVSADDTGS